MIDDKRSDHRVCPSALLNKTLDEGRTDNVPAPDVTLLDVSPPDHNGFCQLWGWSLGQTRTGAACEDLDRRN